MVGCSHGFAACDQFGINESFIFVQSQLFLVPVPAAGEVCTMTSSISKRANGLNKINPTCAGSLVVEDQGGQDEALLSPAAKRQRWVIMFQDGHWRFSTRADTKMATV